MEAFKSYTAFVTTGVADTKGNALVSGYSWSFETGGLLPDNIAPTVGSNTPADGAVDVALSMTITATFDEPMALNTINQTTFLLEDGDGTPLVGDVTYSGNTATFTPLTPLTYDTVYTATIKGDVGGVTDLSGNPMSADHVWTFTTQARSWGAPVKIENQTGNDAIYPKVAMDDAGNAWVLWRYYDNIQLQYDIWMKRYDATLGWQTEVNHYDFTSTLDTATSHRVLMNSNGKAVTLFAKNDANLYSQFYYPQTDTWDTYFDLGGYDAGYDFTFNNDGYIFAAFSSGNSTFARGRIIPSGWDGSSFHLDQTAGVDKYPAISVDESNRALAVYLTPNTSVTYNRYIGSWGSRTVAYDGANMGSVSTWNYYNVELDALGNGIFIFVGNIGSTGTNSLYAMKYEFSSDSWTAPQRIDSRTANVLEAKMDMDPGGSAIIVWVQNDGTADSIFASRYDASAGTWSSPQQIDTLDLTAQAPLGAVDLSGNAYAVWAQDNGSANDIYAARYDVSSDTWSLPKMFDKDLDGNAKNPYIAVNEAGDAIAVWSQEDPDDSNYYSIYAAKLE